MLKHEKCPDCIECTKVLREAKKTAIIEEIKSKQFKRKKTLIEEYAYSYAVEREYGYVYIIGVAGEDFNEPVKIGYTCLLYTSPSPRDRTRSRMPSSA